MKKQAKRKPARGSTAKPIKTKKKLLNAKKTRRGSRVQALPQKPPEDPRYRAAVEQYEAAVRLFQEHKYEKAKTMFEKVMAGPSAELADRARVHLNACIQRLERRSAPIRSPEDHYNVAVAMINSGRLDDAEQHLNRALKLNPRAGHVYYALAAVQSLKSDIDGALDNLKTAIDLEPKNRYLARNDRDFTALAEDPRFADWVYPYKNEG